MHRHRHKQNGDAQAPLLRFVADLQLVMICLQLIQVVEFVRYRAIMKRAISNHTAMLSKHNLLTFGVRIHEYNYPLQESFYKVVCG